ncbi:MAG: PKD domain-containing protein, partial [Nanoarchaeota archaeon]
MFLVFVIPAYAYNQCSTAQQPSYTDCTVYLGWIPFDDYDCDCKADFQDNCEYVWNPFQQDSNGDGVGDACTPSANNPPSINSCSATQTINAGQSATINYAISDPDGDAFSVTVNWGDGSTTPGGQSSASHTYQNSGTYSVRITATDSRGGSTTGNCGTITVNPTTTQPCVAPTGLSPSSTVTLSGDTGNIDLSWNPVPGAVSYNVRLDDGTNDRYDDPHFQTCPNSPHYYCENGITGTRITDVPVKAGGTYSFWVDPIFSPGRNYCNGGTQFNVVKTSVNHPPAISSCNPSSSPVVVGTTATINYAISDPDGDTFSVTVSWGDGTTSAGGTSSASHIYSSTGTFTVT